jgi:hypothetical protein
VELTGQPWEPLTLWQEDTHANHSAPPAVEQVPTTHDTSGQCSPIVFGWFDPDTQCWRTCQATFLSDSEMSKPTWPRSGMTVNGIAYQLPPSAPLTDAIAYSLSLHDVMEWTPTATANQMAPSMLPRNPGRHLWPTPHASPHKYRLQGDSQQSRSLNGVHGGKLNPEWVEWLMGFPIGWTDLDA